MSSPFPALAIVVVNYGSHSLLHHNLVATASAVPGARVVVVDNFSSYEEREQVRTLCAQHGWTAVLLDDNVGFGSGINRAVVTLDDATEHLLFLNPDASIDAASLHALVGQVQEHPQDLVAPIVLTPEGRTSSAGVDLLLSDGQMRSWQRRAADLDLSTVQPWLSGACLVLSRELWERIGGFDDDYFLYWEDVDLSRRVLDAGGRLIVVPEAIAKHDEGATHRGNTPARAKSSLYYYYNIRNRLLFAGKHLSEADQRRWRRSTLRVAYQVLLQGGRRQFAHPRRTIVPAVRGIRDGLRLMHPSGHRG